MTEPDDFRDAVTGIDLRVYFQKRQEVASRVEQFQSPSWALDLGMAAAPTRTRGIVVGGWASLCLALGPGKAVWNGHEAPPGTLCLLPPGAELDGRTIADFRWWTAAVPPVVWQRCVGAAGVGEAAPTRLKACVIPPRRFSRIKRELMEVARLLRDVRTDPVRIGRLVEQQVADLFTLACELTEAAPTPSASPRNRAQLARRAEEWMLAHLAEPVRVPDLCAALRVSRRELEYAFRSTFAQSPRDHLETLRLHAIRRLLLRAADDGLKVIDVAYDHGIQHLGRFAATYRERFGENPIETVKRRGG